ncbi:accessory gene regulator B family protein [Clostridium sp. 19966]|uniref:accessory gene regulator ArgB-like protein n=1 Tax=Clostridium sp. 19966 TaxID=2768166 RepID=UPI0028DF44ED|nr:accessory gene regulator B family protein [Clostridium sp. 19966]MDT8715172.1 accessory gene regulator B family protein [Clostridium sp. 19966]
MLRNFFKSTAHNMSIANGYTKAEEEQIQYTISLLFFETLKLILLLFVFSIIGYFKLSLIAICTMSLIKPFIGGYHEDSQIKCIISTFIMLSSILFLTLHVSFDIGSTIIINVSSVFSIYHTAPVINPKMPLTQKDLIRRNRIIGILFTSMLSLLSIILFKFTIFSNCVMWTILFHALLMFNKHKPKK